MEETILQNGIKISNQKLPEEKSALFIIASNIQNKTEVSKLKLTTFVSKYLRIIGWNYVAEIGLRLQLLKSIFEALKDEGFIITTLPISEKIYFQNLGLDICFSRIISNSDKIVLLKKVSILYKNIIDIFIQMQINDQLHNYRRPNLKWSNKQFE